jgi:hypothetical protein
MKASVESRFHDLIRLRAREFGLVCPEVLPTLDSVSTEEAEPEWFPLPGMYGGFAYWLADPSTGRLMVSSWSRVLGGSGQRHEVLATGFRLLDDGFV